MRMANFIKRLARHLLRDYSFYHIYVCNGRSEILSLDTGFRLQPIEKEEIASSEDKMIVQQAWYHGLNTHAYACMDGSRIVGLCFFWYGERYSKRNFWPLADQEAKLVQLIVLPQMHGRGIARSLIEFATQDMLERGFKRLYARIWRSNTPSLCAFERARWRRLATVIEIYLVFRKNPFRLKLTTILS